ncbi:hypothetical protein U14_03106 [Candidatus Moduliflexus flocculans]|uniref:PBP domain-containing protein n=1 Tax=Candidatus Moduliflexus flocculans TaxID=1499966 RepID=A0A081BN94_9BACT|nr:hypothetical protein U14_03106 [Candidatus Moduliflexus flocculans]
MMLAKRGLLILVFVMCCAALWGGYADAQDVALIMHKGKVKPVSLSEQEIKEVFLGQKTRWEDNSVIRFAVYTEDSALLAFLKSYVKKTPIQYNNYWKKLVFSGKGIMPKMFDDSQKVLDFVSNTEGAISFISAKDVDAQRVVVITVAN